MSPSSRELKGPRPTQLMISKDSHLVRKPQHNPVIIYTQSPKIIHTEPRNFMALVQKLTGLSKPNKEESCHAKKEGSDRHTTTCLSPELVSPLCIDAPPARPALSDVLLYTPTSPELFCSPKSLYRLPKSTRTFGGGASAAFAEAISYI